MRRGRRGARVLGMLALLLAGATTSAAAEWQIKPFAGVTFGGATTYANLDQTSTSQAKRVFGVGGLLLGELFGLEADFGRSPGYFQRDSVNLVTDSAVTTFTGNIVVAAPRHLTEFTLRPYLVGGAGVMHVAIDDALGLLTVSRNLQAMDLGGGVTGFLTNRVGISWDVRYFRSIDRTIQSGLSIGSEHLSFWRASMALAIRI